MYFVLHNATKLKIIYFLINKSIEYHFNYSFSAQTKQTRFFFSVTNCIEIFRRDGANRHRLRGPEVRRLHLRHRHLPRLQHHAAVLEREIEAKLGRCKNFQCFKIFKLKKGFRIFALKKVF